jgi:hypothetical protein
MLAIHLLSFSEGSAFADDGSEKDAGGFLFVAESVEFYPGEQLAAVAAGHAFERGDDDHVPFEAFGFVDGDEIDGPGIER